MNLLARLRSLTTSVGGVACLLAIAILPLWGIVHAFSAHGTSRGLVALFVPPFAAYEGIASVFEKPKWERDWTDMCEMAGATILKSVQDDTDPQLVALRAGLRSWLEDVPTARRADLRAELADLGRVFLQYWGNTLQDMVESRQPRTMRDTSLNLESARFMSNPGLSRLWSRYAEQEPVTQRMLASRFSGAGKQQLKALAEAGTAESARALDLALAEMFQGLSK